MKNGRGVRQGGRLSQILFYLYSKYLTKKALEGFVDQTSKDEGTYVIRTVKYADGLLLPAKEENVIQGMIGKRKMLRNENVKKLR